MMRNSFSFADSSRPQTPFGEDATARQPTPLPALEAELGEDQLEGEAADSSSATQKLKRWSKKIKDNAVGGASAVANVSSKAKKSLKEKLTEGELSGFLKDRRSSSEARLDEVAIVAAPVTVDDSIGAGVDLQGLRRRFEGGSQELTSSGMVRKAMKTEKDGDENSSTSPESGVERSDGEKTAKKSKGDRKKEKKKNGSSGNKEAKKGKKVKKEKKAVTIANGSAKKSREEARPALPPYPKVIDDWTRQGERGTRFYRQLFIKGDVNGNEPRRDGNCDRQPRSALKKTPNGKQLGISSPLKSTTPTLNAYLQERRMVSGSVFKSQTYFSRTLPISVIRSDKFYEARSRFVNGDRPPATFPRSLSNLEKKSSSDKREASSSPQWSNEERNGDVEDSKESRSRSAGATPRPGSALSQAPSEKSLGNQSAVDREEYRHYVLEVMHAAPKNERFQQLQNYYNLLDKALKLEKKSTSMDIHKLKSDEVLDFETWRSLRGKEKAAEELNGLLNDLRSAQKKREFLWRPKEASEMKWRGDAHLRGRDKSVENLRNKFAKIAAERGATEEVRVKVAHMQDAKDTYRPFWRAKSVSDVAADGEKKAIAAASAEEEGKSSVAVRDREEARQHEHEREGDKRRHRTRLPPPRSRSSLTSGQVNALKVSNEAAVQVKCHELIVSFFGPVNKT